jgi:hypothetical protein
MDQVLQEIWMRISHRIGTLQRVILALEASLVHVQALCATSTEGNGRGVDERGGSWSSPAAGESYFFGAH